MTTQTNSIEHVEVIIADIQDHIDKKSDFVGFILISIGIEYLGAFLDAKPFTEFGQSEARFKNGVGFFKNKWYQNNSDFLFKNYRGPLLHQYRIGQGILLTSNCKNGAPLSYHLTEFEGGRIFVLEQLFEDYKDAIRRFKNEANKPGNSFNKEKMGLTHQTIIQIPAQFPQYIPSSGSTTSHLFPMPALRKDIEIDNTLSSGSPS